MIYVVSNQKSLYNYSDFYKIITPAEGIIGVKNLGNLLGFDTETDGLDPHTKQLLSVQLGTFDTQYVFDNTVDWQLLKPIFEDTSLTFIAHYSKFDIKFLYKYHIIPHNIIDTHLIEKLLYLGHKDGSRSKTLQACVKNYLDVFLDKEARGAIVKEAYSEKVIKYAAWDVKYLIPLYNKQLEQVHDKNLQNAVKIECEFVKALAYTEFCGIKLNKEAWEQKAIKDLEEFSKAKQALDNWVLNSPHKEFINNIEQGDLFEGFKGPACKINWSSSAQVAPLLKKLGYNLLVYDSTLRKYNITVESKILKPQIGISDILPLYLNYKEWEKETSTYGYTFLNSINSATKRIHTQFNQLMGTGRLSSGGKDKAAKVSYINFQNIPSDPETRSMFVADKNNVLICSDYSQQEQVILANYAMDKALLKFYDDKLGDMHSYIASKIYKELSNIPLPEIKKNHSDKRQNAKSVGFAIESIY